MPVRYSASKPFLELIYSAFTFQRHEQKYILGIISSIRMNLVHDLAMLAEAAIEPVTIAKKYNGRLAC